MTKAYLIYHGGGKVGCNLGRVVVYGFSLLNNTEQRSVVVMTLLLDSR